MRALLLAVACLATACEPRYRTCAEETTACGCYRRSTAASALAKGSSGDCRMVTEPCWCPSSCDPDIRCVCGTGQFQRCEALDDAGT